MIRGKQVALRSIDRKDLPILMKWRNRSEFRRYFREYRELNLDMQERWFQNTVLGDKNTIMFSIDLDHYYAEDACRLLLTYGFEQINLHKIWAEIYDFDAKKEALFHKFLFHKDGVLREHHFSDGKWCDSIIWSILQKDYASQYNIT